MQRREFITLLGSVAAWPLAARAQQSAAKLLIGYLGSSTRDTSVMEGYRLGLEETGYVEGRNLAIEYRWSDGHYDRLPALADELVKAGVAVIIAGGLPAALAAKAATTTIPIVFVMGADPVALGVVASLNRPGGNITGVSQVFGVVGVKRMELLREVLPAPGMIALLTNPDNPNAQDHLDPVLAAARRVGQPTEVFRASTEHDIDTAFAALAARGARGLLVLDDPFFGAQRDRLVALAARHGIPAIYNSRSPVLTGGLMSYGSNPRDNNRQAGVYVGRILQGARPVDLPVMQPTKFELVINLKTANALGIAIPPNLLVQAEEVIE